MNTRVKIVLLGLMIWVFKFIAGGIGFAVAGEDGSSIEIIWIMGVEAFVVVIGLALALLLVYRGKEQNYKRTAWEAGITWYAIILLMDLVVLIGLLGFLLSHFFI